MIYYLISKEAISIFVTYLLGRDSPCYKEYSSKTDNWDAARPNLSNIDLILNMIYNIYRKSQSVIVSSIDDETVIFYLII